MHALRNWLSCGLLLLALVAAAGGSWAKEIPDTIILGSLADLYGKVNFDHARHVMLLKDCAECHHHTTGTLTHNADCVRCHRNSGATAVVACRGCHKAQPFTAAGLRQEGRMGIYHDDILGLKGAYHQNCMGCHSRMGGPTGCQDCHGRTAKGDAFYDAGAYAPPQGGSKAR